MCNVCCNVILSKANYGYKSFHFIRQPSFLFIIKGFLSVLTGWFMTEFTGDLSDCMLLLDY